MTTNGNGQHWQNRIVGSGEESPDQLLANPYNVRLHPQHQQEALAGVLNEVGWVQQVIVNKRTGNLIDGHLRVSLALRNHEPTIPVVYVDVSEEQEKLILATLDPISALAGTDAAKLDELLRDVQSGEAAVQAMLAELAAGGGLYQTPAPGNGGDDFDTTPAEGPTRTQSGDVWRMGEHLVGCIDSTDREAVARFLGDNTPTMVWADPPYGINIVATNGYVGGGEAYDIPFGGKKAKGLGTVGGAKPFGSAHVRGTDGASNMVEVGKYAPVIGDDTTDTAIKAYGVASALASKAVHIWWGANYYANALPCSSCWIVWDKENTGNFADAELAWCSDDSAVRIFRHMWNGLMRASERGQRRVHPTQKPVALAQWAFEKYGEAGDVIFDPFLGSGISLIAAERLGDGRRVFGCELSPAYVDVCIKRWEAETGQAAELAERLPSSSSVGLMELTV